MSVFVDTSCLYALLVHTEVRHREVLAAFRSLLHEDQPLLTTSYVIVETTALLQSRIGLGPVRDFFDHLLPLLDVQWVGEDLHRKAAARLIREDRRRLSLVDCVSLEFMHAARLTSALALDRHFGQAGYRLIPSLRSSRHS